MGDQLANNPEALRLFFTEDIYLVQHGAAESSMGTLEMMNLHPANSEASQKNTQTSGSTIAEANLAEKLKENVFESLASVQEPASSYTSQVNQVQVDNLNPVLEPQSSSIETNVNFVYRGNNSRNILFLVYDEVNEVTTEEGRELFKNIVKSISLSANDYAIVNYASYKNSSFNELKQFFNATAILTFGVNSVQLGIADYPQHTVVTHEGVKLMFSADLHQLSMDLNMKRALWSALKDMKL
jgi:DNA polymerase III psi subunit